MYDLPKLNIPNPWGSHSRSGWIITTTKSTVKESTVNGRWEDSKTFSQPQNKPNNNCRWENGEGNSSVMNIIMSWQNRSRTFTLSPSSLSKHATIGDNAGDDEVAKSSHGSTKDLYPPLLSLPGSSCTDKILMTSRKSSVAEKN